MPVTLVRPFNTYGPRQSARAVIPTIIAQLLSGADEIKLGALTPTRDLVYVSDTCRGFIELAKCLDAIGEEVNISTQNEISIGELTTSLVEQINPSAQIVCDEQRNRPVNSEEERLLGGNGKLKSLTGWAPSIDLQEGLRRAIQWFRSGDNLTRYKADRYNV